MYPKYAGNGLVYVFVLRSFSLKKLQSSNAVHILSKQVSFASSPDLGLQKEDKFKDANGNLYTMMTEDAGVTWIDLGSYKSAALSNIYCVANYRI
jgi:hypothetical protein